MGKESRLFCHNFARLLTFLRQEGDSQKQQQTVLTLAYVGLRLRDLCSIVNQFQVEDTHLEQLPTLAEEYYHANALLLPTSVNPDWTLRPQTKQRLGQATLFYKSSLKISRSESKPPRQFMKVLQAFLTGFCQKRCPMTNIHGPKTSQLEHAEG